VGDTGSLVTIIANRGINPAVTEEDRSSGYYQSCEIAWRYDQLYSDHRGGGCNVVMCDTSVQFLRDTISTQILAALASRAGAEKIFQGPDGWVIDTTRED
jgi:prepilin-type processing-associated H-X9-DG protein